MHALRFLAQLNLGYVNSKDKYSQIDRESQENCVCNLNFDVNACHVAYA